MNIYIFIGGAYGDAKWVQKTPPTKEDLDSGDFEIFKIDAELRVYQPSMDGWEIVKSIREVFASTTLDDVPVSLRERAFFSSKVKLDWEEPILDYQI